MFKCQLLFPKDAWSRRQNNGKNESASAQSAECCHGLVRVGRDMEVRERDPGEGRKDGGDGGGGIIQAQAASMYSSVIFPLGLPL